MNMGVELQPTIESVKDGNDAYLQTLSRARVRLNNVTGQDRKNSGKLGVVTEDLPEHMWHSEGDALAAATSREVLLHPRALC